MKNSKARKKTSPSRKRTIKQKAEVIIRLELPEVKGRLTPSQELFCRYYSQNSELFANATLSYAEAYGYKLDEMSREQKKIKVGRKTIRQPSEYERAYAFCSMAGSRLIRNDKIQMAIRKFLNELMSNDVIDAELVKTILQDADRPSKMAAIREYNKLKKRITDKLDLTSGGLPIQVVSYEEVKKKK